MTPFSLPWHGRSTAAIRLAAPALSPSSPATTHSMRPPRQKGSPWMILICIRSGLPTSAHAHLRPSRSTNEPLVENATAWYPALPAIDPKTRRENTRRLSRRERTSLADRKTAIQAVRLRAAPMEKTRVHSRPLFLAGRGAVATGRRVGEWGVCVPWRTHPPAGRRQRGAEQPRRSFSGPRFDRVRR
jgi:hypothetical protein